ncbi:signal peptidase II [Aquisalimonas asiatica]|uniref:Lipoprotein signal peptidase n=1 Tax=Aquisalimonas asiatica TaxID=406100 RepID=A0A1H8S3M4_9GAMM|nr:signal peptidase II [Aquisalimonas asiatica]SEO73014.1 signal peptidase II Aspartic peptidase. MEROPS family A08 [Aquisalimonas asiatica]
MRRFVPLWLLVAGSVVVLDQATKLLADAWLDYLQPVALLPVLNLTLSYNPGAAFSLLGDAGGWQRWLFTGFALVVSVALVIWLRRLPPWDRWQTWGLALILGGAVGNVIDRIAYGHVIDFIHVYWRDWHYPIFNVADSAITVGVVLILIHAFFLDDRKQP